MSAGLSRASIGRDAARYSFRMATPITLMAVVYEGYKLATGATAGVEVVPLWWGVVASFVSGILAIAVLLRFVRSRSFSVFVAYRVALAAVVVVTFLARSAEEPGWRS